ncbi:MAG: hypothetical protein JNK46_13560 [Methylobacteriaceae bacterium]|nr:hypothetical protein [Methylobacteriaceae bacterium]
MIRPSTLAALFALTVATAEAQTADPLAPFRAAQDAEQAGPRGAVFDAYFDRWMRRHRVPADPLGFDPRVFVQAQKAIVARGLEAVAAGPVLTSRVGPAPALAFRLFHDRLAATFRARLGLPDAVADALAAEMEAQALDLAGLARPAYLAATGLARPAPAARRAAAAAALDLLWRSSRIDRAFEVPYVAGYDREAADYVFIDCSIPMVARRGGRMIPVGPLLTLHERVEKAILADYATTYPSAHQIALRLERFAAAAAGARWKPYDDLIGEVSTTIAARPSPRISDRLDLQPYYTFADRENLALVAAMGRGALAHAGRADPRPGPAHGIRPVCPPGGLAPQGSSTESQ